MGSSRIRHARLVDERASDLDELALAEPKVADASVEGHVEADRMGDRPGPSTHCPAVDNSSSSGLAQQEEVGQNRQVWEQ